MACVIKGTNRPVLAQWVTSKTDQTIKRH